LAGKRVAILGPAASAFDAAGALLEAGARAVDLFSRGADLARGSAMKPFSFFGAWEHFHALADEARWQVMQHFRRRASFPPVPARLVAAIGRDLFLKDRELHLARVLAPVGEDLPRAA